MKNFILIFLEVGANYVLTPHFLGGEYVAKMIGHSKSGDEDYFQERDNHVHMLKEILARRIIALK